MGGKVEPARGWIGPRVAGDCDVVHEGNESLCWIYELHNFSRAVAD